MTNRTHTPARAHLTPYQRIGYVNREASYADVSLSAGGWFAPAEGPPTWPRPPRVPWRVLLRRLGEIVRGIIPYAGRSWR